MARPMVNVSGNRSRFSEADLGYRRSGKSSFLSVGVGAVASPNETIRCNADQVALIDEIVMTCRTNDSTSNVSAIFNFNGRDAGVLGSPDTLAAKVCKFHFPSAANARRTDRMHLRPLGRMIVCPSSTLSVQASVGSQLSVQISYRMKNLVAAIRDGDISPNGELPRMASSNSVAAGGTVAATAKNIIPGVAGKVIEILGFYHTGHNANAASDDNRLGFWDGATGTFTGNGAMVMRAYAMGADPRWAPRILIDDTNGCIQGPVGEGVYVQASANMASATFDKADYVVNYRYVPAPVPVVAAGIADGGGSTTTMVDAALIGTSLQLIGKAIRFTSGTAANIGQYRTITSFASATGTVTWVLALPAVTAAADTYDIVEVQNSAMPTGVIGQAPIARQKFWYSTEIDPGDASGPANKLFAASSVTAQGQSTELVLNGHAGSGTFADTNESIAGMTLGTFPTNVAWSEYVNAMGDGNTATVSNSWSRYGANLPANASLDPGFLAIESGANQFLTRFQVCWGRFKFYNGGSIGAVPSDNIA